MQPPWTHCQPGSPVTWAHSGLRVTWSHVVAHRQAHTHTGSHTSKRTQSHGLTQSHGRTQAHTQAHTCLPPHTAGTPSPPACMLTVVLELGHLYTKSLPLIPALRTCLLGALLPTSSSLTLQGKSCSSSDGAPVLTGGGPHWTHAYPLELTALCGPSQKREDDTQEGSGFWVWVCVRGRSCHISKCPYA